MAAPIASWLPALLLCGAVVPPLWAQAVPAPVAPNIAAVPASRAPVSPPSGRARQAGDRAYVYRDTSRGDNLWDIAGAVVGRAGRGADAIDRNQVMVAIFRANPQAFPEGNLHAIQRGLDLTIPSLADIRREQRGRAVALIEQHRRAYLDRRLRPQALYAVAGGRVGSEQAALRGAPASVDAPSASPAGPVLAGAGDGGPLAEGDRNAEAGVNGGPSRGLLWGGLAVLLLGGWLLRAWWRKPLRLDPLELYTPPAGNVEPTLEAVAGGAVGKDEQHADAVAASLYAEPLESPDLAAAAPPATETPAQPLPPSDPAQIAQLAKGLADAFDELDRPQAARTWRARGDAAQP